MLGDEFNEAVSTLEGLAGPQDVPAAVAVLRRLREQPDLPDDLRTATETALSRLIAALPPAERPKSLYQRLRKDQIH